MATAKPRPPSFHQGRETQTGFGKVTVGKNQEEKGDTAMNRDKLCQHSMTEMVPRHREDRILPPVDVASRAVPKHGHGNEKRQRMDKTSDIGVPTTRKRNLSRMHSPEPERKGARYLTVDHAQPSCKERVQATDPKRIATNNEQDDSSISSYDMEAGISTEPHDPTKWQQMLIQENDE